MKRDYRQDFPLLRENPIVYLDSAATAQRPDVVIEAEMEFYRNYNANPLRGLYSLGIEATDRYEEARECVAKFIHAASAKEIIFTRNATESLNLIAYSYGLSHLREGDEIIVSILEHHSNQLPWRMVAEKTGAVVKYLECDRQGHISDADLQAAFRKKQSWSQLRRYPMCLVLGHRLKRSSHWQGKAELLLYWMQRSLRRIWKWMYKNWAWISWHFRA